MSEIYYSKAVNEALDEELARDPNVIMIGEDIGCYGGAFGVSKGLWEKYGPERLWELGVDALPALWDKRLRPGRGDADPRP